MRTGSDGCERRSTAADDADAADDGRDARGRLEALGVRALVERFAIEPFSDFPAK